MAINGIQQTIKDAPALPQFENVGNGEDFNAIDFTNNTVVNLGSVMGSLIQYFLKNPETAAMVSETSTYVGFAGAAVSLLEIGSTALNGESVKGVQLLDLGTNIFATTLGIIDPAFCLGSGLWGGLEYASYVTAQNSIFQNASMYIDNANYWNYK